MQAELTPFAFGDNLVRVITDESSNPWFVAKDVCRVLGYAEASNPARLIAHVPKEWTEVNRIHIRSENGVAQEREVLCLSEQGLYFFLNRSDKSGALPVQKWIAGEVLPAIRKTGQFTLSPPILPAATPQAIQMNLPPPPEEALHLHPSMRQRLWQDAMQAARLDNAGSEVALHWFAYLCRMVAQRPLSTFDEVRAFFTECCTPAPGNREKAGVLYEAFRAWRRHIKSPMPSIKAFGQSMNLFARSKKSSGIVYCDIALKK